MFKKLGIFSVKFYRLLISPILISFFGHTCRFTPTCSEYTIEALEKYGFLKGFAFGFKRIISCYR